MNYVHYSIMYLLNAFRDVITWLFTIEIINYENISISIGQTLIYFFIAYAVISFLLNARYSNIGTIKKEQIRHERENNYN